MIRPGIVTPEQADELNQLLDEWRLWKEATHSPPIVSNGQGSLGLDLSSGLTQLGLVIPAKLQPNAAGAYDWVEQTPVVGGTWTPTLGGRTGTATGNYPARDPNGSPSLVGNGVYFLTPGMYGNGTVIQDMLVLGQTSPDALVRATSQTTSVITSSGLAEVQTLTVTGSPTGGTFTVVFNGHTSGTIAWNSDAATAQTTLQATTGIGAGNLLVTGGPLPNVAFVLTFASGLAPGPQSLMTIGTNSLTGDSTPTPSIAETTLGIAADSYNAYPGYVEQFSPYTLASSDSLACWILNLESASLPPLATSEVQTLSITGGTPTSGTFKLTWNGQTTSTIAYNASAATVQTALRALSNVGGTNITCSGGALPGTAVVITFTSTFANLPQNLITAGTNTMNNSAVPSVVRTTSGTSAVMQGFLLGYANDGKAVYDVSQMQTTVTSVNAGSGDSTITLTNPVIEVDLTSGLNVTSDSGKPKILLQAASPTHTGGITTVSQSLLGIKTFQSGIVTNYGTVVLDHSASSFGDFGALSSSNAAIYMESATSIGGLYTGATYLNTPSTVDANLWITTSGNVFYEVGAVNSAGYDPYASGGATHVGVGFFCAYASGVTQFCASGRGSGNNAVFAVNTPDSGLLTGQWGTDPIGNVFSGGICTTVGSGTASGITLRGVFPGATVANTTTETSILGTATAGNGNLAANFWNASLKAINIRVYGTLGTTATPNFTIKVKDTVAPTTLASATFTAFPNGASAFYMDVTIASKDGGGGLVVSGGIWFNNGAAGGSACQFMGITGTPSITVANAETLDVTWTWSTASMLDTVTTTWGIIQ